ncbi:MAG: VanW family protein [Faecousia sp.]
MRHHRVINICLLTLCLVLAAGIAAVILFQGNADPLDNKIMSNVFVAGVDVGGMTREEAYTAVNAAISSNFSDGIMTVELGNSQMILSSTFTRPSLQVYDAVEAAYAYGRTGTSSERQQDFRNAQYSPVEIPLDQFLSVDSDYIRSTVSNFVSGFSGEYTPSGYSLEGDRPSLDADDFDRSAPCQTLVLEIGVPGSNYDLDGICRTIYEGYSQNNFDVVIPDTYLPQFPEKLDIDAIYQELHVDAVEAVEESGSGEVVPGSCGYTFSLEDARAQLSSADYGQVISIPMEYIMPEKLDINGSFVETLSSFSTPVSTNEAYNQNMKLLCKQLDGLILEPGDNFSFDAFFNNRTEAAGYQLAPRHGDHCIDEEVCGGADQIATTLYVAAMTADLTVTQKSTADHLCDYTIKGTEISVSANWQDLKLSNSFKFPVKIRAKATDKQVTIQILSEQPLDYYIKLETKDGYAISHGTTFVSKKAADGYTNGQVLLEGIDGCQVTLQRVKYDKATNAEISRTSEYVESRPVHTVIVNVSG